MGATQSLSLEYHLPKQPGPLGVRIEPDLEERLEALAKKLGQKKHAIAAAAIRLGAALIEKDEEQFYVANTAALKAKAQANVASLDEHKETKKKEAKPKK